MANLETSTASVLPFEDPMVAFDDESAEKTLALAVTVDSSHLKYAAVLVRSALDHLSSDWRLRAFILACGLDEHDRRRIENSWADDRLSIEWPTLDLEMIRGRWPGATGSGIVLYYRLYLAEALPPTVNRVLFLDADTLVTGDLVELWRSPFEGMAVQAVPDTYARVVHLSRLSDPNLPDDIRLDPAAGYFNAGVMLIDLGKWRCDKVGAQATSLMWRYREVLLSRDQDALNCVLSGRWKPLSVAWNFHEIPGATRTWQTPADSAESLRKAILSPRIVHFIGCKPWDPDCRHIDRERWRRAARAAGVSTIRGGPLFRWFRAPLYDLQWQLRRGVLEAKDLARTWAAARQVLLKPWLLLEYPVWSAWRRFRLLGRARSGIR